MERETSCEARRGVRSVAFVAERTAQHTAVDRALIRRRLAHAPSVSLVRLGDAVDDLEP